jgi:hypothetical protein
MVKVCDSCIGDKEAYAKAQRSYDLRKCQKLISDPVLYDKMMDEFFEVCGENGLDPFDASALISLLREHDYS